MCIELPTGSPEEWLNTVQDYQRDILNSLMVENSPDVAAKLWFEATPGLAQFGGERTWVSYWQDFRREFRNFLCNEKDYKSEKQTLSEHLVVNRELLVAVASSAIAAKLGLAASFIAPPVVLFLVSLSTVGVRAFCNEGPAPDPNT